MFDALDTVDLCLDVLPPMLKTATFFPERMRAAAAAGFLNATDCADYLVSKGVPFRDAYAISVVSCACASKRAKPSIHCPSRSTARCTPAFDSDVYSFIDLANCVSKRKVYGGPAPEAVRVQIANAEPAVPGPAVPAASSCRAEAASIRPHARGADALGCVPGER